MRCEEGRGTSSTPGAGLRHASLPYRDAAERAAGVRAAVGEALERGERVLLAVSGERVGALRSALGARAAQVTALDVATHAVNPARLLPALHEFAAAAGDGRRCSVVAETAWPGRPRDELDEALRHDALANLALAGAPVDLLCLFDASGLDGSTIAASERAHPAVCCAGDTLPSPRYGDPAAMADGCVRPLPEPAPGALALEFDHDLARLRRFVHAHALGARLPAARIADLLVAANEAATNTLVHTGRPGVVRVWCEPLRLVVEFLDGGTITDPLAGCRLPDPQAESGRGLWLVNQLCDLVQLRSGARGTTLRLHVRLGEAPAAAQL